MSDALNYLVEVRGDALGHYFKFLKDAGKHLDPKTRNLISVITKVDVQTEPGFKQYLMRALREGCTPMEIIDALLMAFPALGLAKIIWAVDIILEMNIPGFQPIPCADIGPRLDEYRLTMPLLPPSLDPEPGGFLGAATVTLAARDLLHVRR